ncbi:MAG: hypothetical protein ABI629_20670, partial [bacterium]
MKSQLLGFFDALRQSGLMPSVGETLDAVAAVQAVGIERPLLREALAAALVKDHADRAAFDATFDHYFALPMVSAAWRAKPPSQGEGAGRTGPGAGRGVQPEGRAGSDAGAEAQARRPTPSEQPHAAAALARQKALADRPFRDMDAVEVDALDELVAALGGGLRARFARRSRR